MKHKFNDPALSSFLKMNLFCMALLLFRVVFTATPFYLFLVWNLFLAWVPLVVSIWSEPRTTQRTAWILGFGTWLLFLPNAPYILTDLLHFRNNQDMAGWFDLLLLCSFGVSGLLIGLESLFRMHRQLNTVVGKEKASAVVLASCLLCGAGIFLGRFLRYNSWNIITDPLSLLSDLDLLLSWRGAGVSIGFGLLFHFSYSFICNHFKTLRHVSSN